MGLREKLRRYMFGYDASENTGRRRQRPLSLRSEDWNLRPLQRKRLISDANDLRRNYSVAAWMIRKHLDYVSTFSFQCRSGNRALDEQVEALMTWWSRPLNCDVAARHSLPRLTRLAESLRTVGGDCLVVKLSDGHIQLIEPDRIVNPTQGLPSNIDGSKLTHGVETTATGKASRFIICDRTGGLSNGFQFKVALPARYCFHHGYFDRYDQVRGISPLASAINSFSDVYEASEYALAKAKVAQIFGLKLSRDAKDAPVPVEGDATTGYVFDFGRGPQVLDLKPGDEADFMESKTPSTEFAQYMDKMIGVSLKALDIPFCFYDESSTTYSGGRQALLMYEQSARIRRQDNRDLLNQLTAWRLQMFIDDGELTLPAGMMLSDIKWEWISSAGVPWLDPLKESTSDVMLVQAGLRSRTEICKERGKDWYAVVDQIAAEQEYLKSKGIEPATPAISIGVSTDASNSN